MALSPTSSRPTFNGGTITSGLVVNPPIHTAGLVVHAASGSTSNVLEVYADASDTANTALTVDQHGNLHIASGGSYQEAALNLVDNTSGNIGSIYLDTYLGVLIGVEASSNALLTLDPKPTHSGRLVVAHDSAGAEGLAIIPDAYLVIKRHAAPADGALAAGECALWFDQTNGAGKLMVKAKTANGTVATGSVNLA